LVHDIVLDFWLFDTSLVLFLVVPAIRFPSSFKLSSKLVSVMILGLSGTGAESVHKAESEGSLPDAFTCEGVDIDGVDPAILIGSGKLHGGAQA
jgi:hypothetical protein